VGALLKRLIPPMGDIARQAGRLDMRGLYSAKPAEPHGTQGCGLPKRP
jgi:hypothetical protein